MFYSHDFVYVGKFLSLKEEGVESVDAADRFYYWLDHVGIKGKFLYLCLKLVLQSPYIIARNGTHVYLCFNLTILHAACPALPYPAL